MGDRYFQPITKLKKADEREKRHLQWKKRHLHTFGAQVNLQLTKSKTRSIEYSFSIHKELTKSWLLNKIFVSDSYFISQSTSPCSSYRITSSQAVITPLLSHLTLASRSLSRSRSFLRVSRIPQCYIFDFSIPYISIICRHEKSTYTTTFPTFPLPCLGASWTLRASVKFQVLRETTVGH